MSQDLVSVIIPTCDRPKELERAIRSVLEQSYAPVEIIVVDDASTVDHESLLQKYPEVTLLVNSENKGQSYSRNRGLEAANGAFINFLDDDDEMMPQKIEKQVTVFRSSDDPDLGMVTCHAFDGRFGSHRQVNNAVRGNIRKKLLSRFRVRGVETMLYRKEVFDKIGGFDESLRAHEEYDLMIRASGHFTFDFVDEVLSREHSSSDQDSLDFDKRIRATSLLYKKHRSSFFREGLLFGIGISVKYTLLILRYWIGKVFGTKAYLFLLR